MLWERITPCQKGNLISVPLVAYASGLMHIITDQIFVLLGYRAAAGVQLTAHCWTVGDVSPSGEVFLMPLKDLCCIQMSSSSDDDFRFVTEICAGMGGTSCGAQWAGFLPLCAMDISDHACQHLRLNDYPKVLRGDVSNRTDVRDFHFATGGRRAGMLVGFPCQPFSKLGRGRSFQDPRAKVFFSALDVSLLCHASFIIMECVVGAKDHPLTIQTLDRYCELRGFHWKGGVLHLHNALPSFRTRWWVIIAHKDHPLCELPDLPVAELRQHLRQIFPQKVQWPLEEEQLLALTPIEMQAFNDSAFGAHPRFLNMDGRAPTLLHSAAHHFEPCPCGCRPAFSGQTLMDRGIHGIVLHGSYAEVPYRHLHPREASLLVGMPADMKYQHPRAVLPLLGQIASPVQAHWVLLHFLFGDDNLYMQHSLEQVHEDRMQLLIQEHLLQWPTPAMYLPRELRVHIHEEAFLTTTLTTPCSWRDCQQATSALRDPRGELLQHELLNLFPKALIDPYLHDVSFHCRGAGVHRALDRNKLEDPFEGLDDLVMHREGHRLCLSAADPCLAFLSPREIQLSLALGSAHHQVLSMAQLVQQKFHVAAIFWDEGHWIFCDFKIVRTHIYVHVYDGLVRNPTEVLRHFIGITCEALGNFPFSIHWHHPISQSGGHHCGTIALLNMGLKLGLWTSFTETGTMNFASPCASLEMVQLLRKPPLIGSQRSSQQRGFQRKRQPTGQS